MQKDKTLVFKEFGSTGEANIIKSLLESNGIQCFLSNENNPFTGSILTDSLFGIRLNLMEKDMQRAQELLDSIQSESAQKEAEEEK